MNEIWDRIEAWLAKNAPAVLAGLNGPASEQEIDATERALGVTLPEDVRASYRRHNGQRGLDNSLFVYGDFLTLQGMRGEWDCWYGVVDGSDIAEQENDADWRYVQRNWWHPAWIPFAVHAGGDSLCIDLAPGKRGTRGQIIEMIHDDGQRPIHADSFREWLSDLADELERDEYVYAPEYGGRLKRRDGRGW